LDCKVLQELTEQLDKWGLKVNRDHKVQLEILELQVLKDYKE
jgi:hypothetical protein